VRALFVLFRPWFPWACWFVIVTHCLLPLPFLRARVVYTVPGYGLRSFIVVLQPYAYRFPIVLNVIVMRYSWIAVGYGLPHSSPCHCPLFICCAVYSLPLLLLIVVICCSSCDLPRILPALPLPLFCLPDVRYVPRVIYHVTLDWSHYCYCCTICYNAPIPDLLFIVYLVVVVNLCIRCCCCYLHLRSAFNTVLPLCSLFTVTLLRYNVCDALPLNVMPHRLPWFGYRVVILVPGFVCCGGC